MGHSRKRTCDCRKVYRKMAILKDRYSLIFVIERIDNIYSVAQIAKWNECSFQITVNTG